MNEFLPAFNIGDVVQLKSGGPTATVTWCAASGTKALYYNPVSGNFDSFMVSQDCLKYAAGKPELPSDSRTLRNTSVTKSSLS